MALAEEFGKNAATVLALLCFLSESLKDLAFVISMDNQFVLPNYCFRSSKKLDMKLQVNTQKQSRKKRPIGPH